jgi:hypothetical protein
MNALAEQHPVQLVMGGLLLAEELAAKDRQLSLACLCDMAAEWCDSARAVFAEIAADAGCGETLVDEVAKDGVITPTEARQLRGLFEEIGTEAREGRIV